MYKNHTKVYIGISLALHIMIQYINYDIQTPSYKHCLFASYLWSIDFCTELYTESDIKGKSVSIIDYL